jgi:hypothetical protein
MNNTAAATVKIDGRDITFRFGMNAYMEFMHLREQPWENLNELLKTDPMRSMRGIFYAAALLGTPKEQLPENFDELMVGDWWDQMDQKDLDHCIAAYRNSRIGKKMRSRTRMNLWTRIRLAWQVQKKLKQSV